MQTTDTTSDNHRPPPELPLCRPMDYFLFPLFVLAFVAVLIVLHLVQVLAILAEKLSKKPHFHQATISWLGHGLLGALRVLGIRIEYEIHGTFTADRPYIILSNHQSMLDIPIIYVALRELRPRFVAKKELSHWLPSVSLNLRYGGSALIDRNDARQSIREITALGKRMNERGFSSVLFPEGTRARDGVLKKYRKPGFSALAKAIPDAEIIPVTIDNSWILSARPRGPIPRHLVIHCRVHEAMSRDGKSIEELLAIAESIAREDLDNWRGK